MTYFTLARPNGARLRLANEKRQCLSKSKCSIAHVYVFRFFEEGIARLSPYHLLMHKQIRRELLECFF